MLQKKPRMRRRREMEMSKTALTKYLPRKNVCVLTDPYNVRLEKKELKQSHFKCFINNPFHSLTCLQISNSLTRFCYSSL